MKAALQRLLRLTFAVFIMNTGIQNAQATPVQLAGVFGDHMVLQRNAPIPVWGLALAGSTVRVSLRGATRSTRTGPDGRWRVNLPPAPAGGPYELRVKADRTLVLRDVLVGDVWLCSGQSNMEWTLAQSQDAEREVAAAQHPTIRHLKVPRRASLSPQEDMAAASWQVSSPATAGEFSAVAYYFALRLQRELKTRTGASGAAVPIGLINASWGGSHIETWTSPRATRADPVLAAFMQTHPADVAAFVAFQRDKTLALVRRWQGDLPMAPGVEANVGQPPRPDWEAPGLDDGNWPTLNAPQIWEEQGLPHFDGRLWYRKRVDLNPEQAAGAAQLHLGAIDDCDETWVNGQRVGGLCQWDAQRQYTVPAGVLRAGSNVIAVRVLDTGGAGGFHGAPSAMRLATAAGDLPLHGAWKARVESPLLKSELSFNDAPTLLFNGMLQPLLPLRLSGVLWYQGESNVGRAARYVQDFQNLITDWRAHWQQPKLPFLYVQLASFLPVASNSLQSSAWAEMRDAQRQALALPATGMAVATDVGNANDIHPRDKRTVGERLAGLALQTAYGRSGVVANGPVLRHLGVQAGGRLELTFDGSLPAQALAVRGGGALAGFAVAGPDGRFVPAQAQLQAQRVVVWNDDLSTPVAVRYGWVNNPEQANLINRAGLPASPFRTDTAPWITQGVVPNF
jgi:sialate O-acetylesterase